MSRGKGDKKYKEGGRECQPTQAEIANTHTHSTKGIKYSLFIVFM